MKSMLINWTVLRKQKIFTILYYNVFWTQQKIYTFGNKPFFLHKIHCFTFIVIPLNSQKAYDIYVYECKWYLIILSDIGMAQNMELWKGARTHGMAWTLSCGDIAENDFVKINVFLFLQIVFLIFTAGPYNLSLYCRPWISYFRYKFGHIHLKTELSLIHMSHFYSWHCLFS